MCKKNFSIKIQIIHKQQEFESIAVLFIIIIKSTCTLRTSNHFNHSKNITGPGEINLGKPHSIPNCCTDYRDPLLINPFTMMSHLFVFFCSLLIYATISVYMCKFSNCVWHNLLDWTDRLKSGLFIFAYSFFLVPFGDTQSVTHAMIK